VNAYVSRDADLARLHPPAAAAHTGSVLRPMTKPRDPRNKDHDRAIDYQRAGKITPGRLDYARTLSQMIRSRFDAVAHEKIPDQLSNLVASLKGTPSRAQKHEPVETEEQHGGETEQDPSFITCPYCLGLGERSGPNAAQPAVCCSWCGGRGFIRTVPKPTDL
jgi:hypothetical protein